MKNKIIGYAFTAMALFCVQSALAFYNPSTGRWLSRDPMEDKAFRTLTSPLLKSIVLRSWEQGLEMFRYTYVANNASMQFDILGLWTAVNHQPNPKYNTIVCDRDGHVVPRLGKPLPTHSTLCIGRCYEEHESIHCIDIQNSNPNACAGVPAGAAIIPDNQTERKVSEIRAYNQEKTCLNNYLLACPQVCSPSNIRARIHEVEMKLQLWQAFVPDVGNNYPE